jgi:hypothetical protein
MDPSASVDVAAPSTYTTYSHRLSQLSTSTMDDDFLSDYQRGLDSPSSDISESALIGKDTQLLYTQTGMLTKGLFAQSLENHDCNMVVESPEQSSTPLLEPLRDVEQLDVKQVDSLLHSTLPSSIQEQLDFLLDREHLDDPRALMARPIPDEEKKSKMSKLLARAASNGDLDRVADVLENFSEWVDINLHDEDGSTPLIYASCFGHTRAVSMLLDGGACVDERDSFGWTALVWATNNKHEEIVRLLLNHGASPKAQTSNGRTVADFLRHDPNDTSKIVKIFKETKRVHTSSQSNRVPLQYIHRVDRELMTEEERQHRPQADFDGIAELDAEMTENFDAQSLFDQVRIALPFDLVHMSMGCEHNSSASSTPHAVLNHVYWVEARWGEIGNVKKGVSCNCALQTQ